MSARPTGRVASDAMALAVTVSGTVVVATWIDPHLSLLASPPLALAINAVIPLFAALATLALSGRWLLALLAAALVTGVLCGIDHFKMQALYNNLVFADLKLVPELAKAPTLVVGFARLGAGEWALLALGVVVACAAVLLALRMRPAIAWTRVPVAFVVIGAAAWIGQHKLSHHVPSIGWLLPMQIAGAAKAGVAGNILLGGMASTNVKPRAFADRIAGFWADPHVQAAHQRLSVADTAHRPDIVFVQSESLFEPSLLCGFADTPVLQTLAGLPGDGFQNLKVPVFGHRTLQTEFEVLTGFPVRFAPNSLFAYYELVDKPIPSLPRQLAALGYRTIGVHPNRRSFWRRDYAWPAMAFETFIDGSFYFRPADFSRFGWVSDEAMTRTILSKLDDNPAPTLLFAVSIENHGPWGTKGGAPPEAEALVPDTLQGPARAELVDYVARAQNADRLLRVVIDALAQRERPTLVVFYGDHLPPLDQVYPQVCFKDGQRPDRHSPPLRVWSNFALREAFDGETHSYLLAARVLRAAGLPLDGAFLAGAITDLVQRDPSVPPQDKQRILDLYAHVATQAVFATPVATKTPLAFVTQPHATEHLLGMQSTGTPLVRHEENPRVQGAVLPDAGDATDGVSFHLGKRVASAVVRPYLRPTGGQCVAEARGESTLDVLADDQVIARARIDDGAIVGRVLPLSGVETLTLRLRAGAPRAACDEVAFTVGQMLCYSPRCDVAGQSAAHAPRAAN